MARKKNINEAEYNNHRKSLLKAGIPLLGSLCFALAGTLAASAALPALVILGTFGLSALCATAVAAAGVKAVIAGNSELAREITSFEASKLTQDNTSNHTRTQKQYLQGRTQCVDRNIKEKAPDLVTEDVIKEAERYLGEQRGKKGKEY